MKDFVSVIIPVYNDPERIRKALDAIVAQTYPREFYEIIVADNGSNDDTSWVIEQYTRKYRGRVRFVLESKIQSSYAARNKAIAEAKGHILAFTDSDCIPEPNWIEAGICALKNKRASCGGGHITFFYKAKQPNLYEFYDSSRKLNQQSFVESAGFAATANFFAEKRLFEQYGLFRNGLISGGDYEFGRRLTKGGEKLIYVPNAVVKHPARSTFREIYKKSKRVAIGQKELQSLGLLKHSTLSWRSWLPFVGYIRTKAVNFIQKGYLLLLANFFHYMNLLRRIL